MKPGEIVKFAHPSILDGWQEGGGYAMHIGPDKFLPFCRDSGRKRDPNGSVFTTRDIRKEAVSLHPDFISSVDPASFSTIKVSFSCAEWYEIFTLFPETLDGFQAFVKGSQENDWLIPVLADLQVKRAELSLLKAYEPSSGLTGLLIDVAKSIEEAVKKLDGVKPEDFGNGAYFAKNAREFALSAVEGYRYIATTLKP